MAVNILHWPTSAALARNRDDNGEMFLQSCRGDVWCYRGRAIGRVIESTCGQSTITLARPRVHNHDLIWDSGDWVALSYTDATDPVLDMYVIPNSLLS